ncbi:hypothetical protein [Nocardia sp. NPDC051981]|uniref:LppU/SCO3897 family protein n=1 Tax=Nocardia sp. NPDC051981 TaxID=3155417 RepID=UPI003434FFF4
MALIGSGVAAGYPNLYEGLPVGGCASRDTTNDTAGPVDCNSAAAKYRLIEQYQLTAETQDQRCGPHATLSYHHRTDDGFRLALYCFTYNMTVDSCWNLSDVNDPDRLDCDAHLPGAERVTEVIEGVADGSRCPAVSIVYPRLELTVCVIPD